MFGPVSELLAQPRHPQLAAAVALAYLLAALLLFATGRRGAVESQVAAGVAGDILVTALAMHALPSLASSIAMMLLFNVGAAALLLPLRRGLAVAGAASLALLLQYAWAVAVGEVDARPAVEVVMFATSYLAIATLTSVLGRQLRASQALAEQRGSQVANLAEVNELIIRRMRTGVLLVDGNDEIRPAKAAGCWPPPRRPWRPACADGSATATTTPPRCSWPPTCPKCCPALPACWPRATRCWCSWTTPSWPRGARKP